MTKIAILQMADCGPAESTAVMLRAAGYDVYLPDDRLRGILREIGCDTVLSAKELVRSWGYEHPRIPYIGPDGMAQCSLFCDVKAHRSYNRIVRYWPRLADRVLWTRINGGKPEHVIRRNDRGEVTEDCGDEVNPPCPVLTPNLWYEGKKRAYACWPPFARLEEYNPANRPREPAQYTAPVCLIHNVRGWGYQAVVEPFRQLGVKFLGVGCPDGLAQHKTARGHLSQALAMVHCKSSDAPGYALYEALASGCPVVCTGRLIWRCRMQSLLIPGKTCLTFDRRETHDGLTEEQVAEDTHLVKKILEALQIPALNSQIGESGRRQLEAVMWDENRDGPGFRNWMERMFP